MFSEIGFGGVCKIDIFFTRSPEGVAKNFFYWGSHGTSMPKLQLVMWWKQIGIASVYSIGTAFIEPGGKLQITSDQLETERRNS